MAGKQMEGDNPARRKVAKRARDVGQSPSEVGGSFGANKQPTKAKRPMSHQERIDLRREGKQRVNAAHTASARPGSRDTDTADHERFPRLRKKRP